MTEDQNDYLQTWPFTANDDIAVIYINTVIIPDIDSYLAFKQTARPHVCNTN